MQGPQGRQGEQGDTGPVGPQGEKGDRGQKGLDGLNAPVHFVRVVRKEGTSVSDQDYYVENISEIVQVNEYYIVNPAGGGDIPSTNNASFAIKDNDGVITYSEPNNGDTAMIYADRQVDITDGDGNVSQSNENRIVAILVHEGGQWIITNSYFKNANNVTETGAFANAEGISTTASGETSHAEGTESTASGRISHAEGFNTTASGITSHAEGLLTEATGDYSHSEGDTTLASGQASHAEGLRTTASGRASHAQGFNTTVSNNYGHIQGRYGVVGDDDTLSGIAYGDSVPTDDEKTGSADVGLVWKVDQSGNTTQIGKVVAESFEKIDGTPITGGGGGEQGPQGNYDVKLYARVAHGDTPPRTPSASYDGTTLSGISSGWQADILRRSDRR